MEYLILFGLGVMAKKIYDIENEDRKYWEAWFKNKKSER